MLYIASFVIIIIVVAALVYLRENRRLKAQAKECAKEAKRFHDKLQELSAPTRFFTDEEAQHLKKEFAPLLKKVNKLYENIFISSDYLDKSGLRDFLDERRLVNHRQYRNNEEYNKRYYNK